MTHGAEWCAGGGSLPVCMSPHGPDATTYEMASDTAKALGPQKVPNSTLAFMFEVNATPCITPHALCSKELDTEYYKCWHGLRSHFTGNIEGNRDNGPAANGEEQASTKAAQVDPQRVQGKNGAVDIQHMAHGVFWAPLQE